MGIVLPPVPFLIECRIARVALNAEWCSCVFPNISLYEPIRSL